MATLEDADGSAADDGADRELVTPGDADGEQTLNSPERRHVDALLDISEEDMFKELEPHEYHCYSGWEEAVQGWARVAPLCGILLPQKRYRKPKQKEADNPAPLAVDPTIPNAGSSASVAEHPCESHVGLHSSLKKAMPLNQRTGSWGHIAVPALQKDVSEWPVLSAMQKTVSNIFLEEKMEQEAMLRETPSQTHHLSSKYSVSENRPTKPQKHRPNNTVVPIKNFTFLPPIKSPHLNLQKVSGQLCSGKKAPGGETMEENCFMFDKKSGTRGTRLDPVANPEPPTYPAALTSKYRACQHNPHQFSAVSVSVPKRYQVPLSSKPDTVHRTSYSVGRSLTQALHSGTAAGAQAHMCPSKTVCAVKLYEGCEINV